MRLEEFENVNEGPLAKKLGTAALAGAAMVGLHQANKPAQAYNTKPAVQQTTNHISIDQEEMLAMALTMWGEARNQGVEGMRAVGHVIKNRADSNHPKMFGTGIEGVALAPKQFSAWNAGDPNRDKMLNIQDLKPGMPGYDEWLEAQELAEKIIQGRDPDPTDGSLYYHTTAVNPGWAKTIDPVAQIGDHLFYNEIPRAI
jgi:spore germination cell wall hydrolase CwlJ-like protein